jgi:2-polyprenyl-3-methyl-5-hydroxy-6-metoxy-1,4-benzoquinol methylase
MEEIISRKRAENYWNQRALRYEQIYLGRKSKVVRIFDKIIRKAFQERINFTYKLLGNIGGKTILDSGCGPGVYLIEALNRGAVRVTGIDFSQEMINRAHSVISRTHPHNHNWDLQKKDLDTFIPIDSYDVVLIVGVLEYLEDPLKVLKVFQKAVRDCIIVTFSYKYSLYSILRFLLTSIQGIKITLNTLDNLEILAQKAGFKISKARRIGPSYLVLMKPCNIKSDV